MPKVVSQGKFGFWRAVRITLASAFLTGLLWIAWDHAQSLFWLGGPSLNPTDYWFTPFVVYVLVQAPAIVGVGAYHLIFSRLHRARTRFLLYPFVSLTCMLTAGFVASINLSMSMTMFLLVAIPKTAIYELAFAGFDYAAGRRRLAVG
jgi:hypothetical protein